MAASVRRVDLCKRTIFKRMQYDCWMVVLLSSTLQFVEAIIAE